MELGLKEPRGVVRENYSVDNLATGIVLRETTAGPEQAVSGSGAMGACSSPETGVYYIDSVCVTTRRTSWWCSGSASDS